MSQSGKFSSALFQQHRVTNLRYFHGAIAPSRHGDSVAGFRRREWQWRRKNSHVTTTMTTMTPVAVGEVTLTVHPCVLSTWSTNPLCLPTTYLPTYLPTYISIHTSFALAGSLPRPASIACICITRTFLSIALPQLASSPRLLPSRTGKRRNEKKTLDHPRFSPPRSQWSTRDPTVLVSRCASVGLCLHWYRYQRYQGLLLL